MKPEIEAALDEAAEAMNDAVNAAEQKGASAHVGAAIRNHQGQLATLRAALEAAPDPEEVALLRASYDRAIALIASASWCFLPRHKRATTVDEERAFWSGYLSQPHDDAVTAWQEAHR